MDNLSSVCIFQCCRSTRVGVLGAVVVVEAAVTTVRCFRHLPHIKYRLRGQEIWTICLAVVAAYWRPAGAQGVVIDIRQAPNLPILPHLYITRRQVSTSFVRIIPRREYVAHTAAQNTKICCGRVYNATKRRCCVFFTFHKPRKKNYSLFAVCFETIM
jgi:hypothetical protein